MKHIGLLVLVALSGCDTVSALMHPVSPAEVAAVELALTTAEKLAVNYTQLPACGSATATKVCADPTLKAKIKTDDNAAYAAVQTLKSSSASGAPAALTAAQTAIQAFQSDVPAASN